MKRWIPIVILLLLVPLTLAPRTSWTLDEVDYDLTAAARDSMRVKAAAPLTLRLLSRSDEVIDDAQLVIDVSVDGKDAVHVVSASRGCAIEGSTVTCAVAPIAPRGQGVVRIVARPLMKGSLLYEVTEGNSGAEFGTAVVHVASSARATHR